MDKERFIKINGKKVSVTEDVYSAFKRPAWRERKQKQVRADNERSLDEFMADGYDIPSAQALVDEIVEDKLLLEALYAALDELTDDERFLIDSLYYNEQPMREYARQAGTNHTKIIRQHNRVIGKLRDILKKYL